MKNNRWLVFLTWCFLQGCNTLPTKTEKLLLLDFELLENKRAKIEAGDNEAILGYDRLIKSADDVLVSRSFSVMNKKGIPPSENKHDYMSIGPYWWPNPDTSHGLPYVRRDGRINSESRNDFTDFVELETFFLSTSTLKDAYYFSGNETYAKKAHQLIKAWFLEDATRMNPNLNYGQSIPGIVDGRGFAIIEFQNITEVLKCLELLELREMLDEDTKRGMNNWLTEYAFWLQNSKNGIEEAKTKNNHGTFYDLQLLSILTYLGRIEEVKHYLTDITTNRIFTQIEPDGSQPKELERTKSFSYSVMNLHGFLYLARLGQKVGVDLWGMESEDGRSIKRGYQYLVPYMIGLKNWEYQQITDTDVYEEKLINDFAKIEAFFKEYSFSAHIDQIKKSQPSDLRLSTYTGN